MIRRYIVVVAAIALAFTGIFAFALTSVNHATEETVDTINEIYLEELSSQILAYFESVTTAKYQEMEGVARTFAYMDIETQDELAAFIAEQRGIYGFSYYGLMTADGMCYSDTGLTYLSDNQAEIDRLVAGGKKMVLSEGDAEDGEVLCFAPTEKMVYQGVELIGIIASYETSTLAEKLSINQSLGNSLSGVITRDGTQIIHSTATGSAIPNSGNLYATLQGKAEFEDGYTYDQVVSAIASGSTLLVPLTYDGQHEYLYFTPIPKTDWYLYTIMPYGVIDESIAELGSALLQNMLLISAGILILVALFFIAFFNISRTNNMRLREEKNRAERAFDQAQHANMAKSEFLSRMSHEIRTPMNGIIGMTEIASQNADDPEKVRESLRKIKMSSNHLLSLINDILDMSKIESGKIEIRREQFDFKAFVESVTAIFHTQANEKGVAFETVLSGDVDEEIVGDSMRLGQIIFNLLSNAIKFTPAGGTITFRITKLAEVKNVVSMRFEVIDTGYGIAAENLDKIFRSFEQESSSIARKFGGTGLGLAITKRLVEIMGGWIRVRSVVGQGSTFTVEMPFALPEAIEADSERFIDTRVLVVDDDRETCRYVKMLLVKHGVDAESALSGEEAVSRVEKAHKAGKDFDLFIIDWKLPEMDGLEVVRRIHAITGDDKTSSVLITAYDTQEVEAQAREAGVTAVIGKPLFESSIISALEHMTIRNTEGEEPESEVEVEAPPPSQPDSYDFSNRRILIAEDNELNLEIAVELLKPTGAQVDTATDGKQALDAFAASEVGYYDLILMDVQMPGMGGLEATIAIRALDRPDAKKVQIFAMTANAFAEDERRSLAAGMNAHISKPLDIRTLFKKIAEYVDGGAKGGGE